MIMILKKTKTKIKTMKKIYLIKVFLKQYLLLFILSRIFLEFPVSKVRHDKGIKVCNLKKMKKKKNLSLFACDMTAYVKISKDYRKTIAIIDVLSVKDI